MPPASPAAPPGPPWEPIPQEGGWFVPGPRTEALGGILALIDDTPAGFSALHRLTVTEGWQWIGDDPLELLLLHPDGTCDVLRLDADRAQAIVPAGSWQGARTLGRRSRFACWCAPAFTPEVFTLGHRDDLVAAYPHQEDRIRMLTREEIP